MARLRVGLEWKVGALMSALAAGLVLAGVGAVWVRTQRLAGPELEDAVLRAGDQVEDAVAARLDRLDLITRLLVNDPPFRAYVAEGHLPSVIDNLQDRLSLYALDAFLIADARGAPIADTRRPAGEPPRSAMVETVPSLLATALAGDPALGLWVDPDGTIYLAAAAPLPAGEASAIVALEEVGGALVSDLRQATGAELVFFSGSPDSIVPGASTLPLSRSQLMRILSIDGLKGGAPPRRLDADGEEFVARIALLTGEAGQPAGFLALRSVDRELASFRKIQTTLLVVGLAAIPLALLLGGAFARRITRPIATLVRATERVRAGDYGAPLPPETHDEMGVLAGAFRMMVSQLKEKEEMDAWIGALAARVAGEPRMRGESATPPSGAPTRGMERRREVDETIAPGSILQNRFRVMSRLGAGGMGTVWKVQDERLGEIVALKVLPADVMAADPERMERFRQEITLARRITHRNVLRTHELLELEDAWAILMEHVDGAPLGRLLAGGRFPRAAGIRIATQICDGLEAAHAQGVVHRDLKPANVLVDTAGGVKIGDFGLARAADSAGGLTKGGAAMGTPHYMSPEQALGLAVDRRADIYSAGVMFYEIFCGRRPFEADSALALLRAHVDTAPPPPRSVNASLDPDLEAILMKALAKDPSDRYPSARDLREALAHTSAAGSGGPTKGRASIAGRLVLMMILSVACGVGSARAERPEPEPESAGRWSSLFWTGDAFFRYETVRGAPNPETSDFERARLRLRPGLEAITGSGRLTAGVGLLASLASDRNAENEIRLDNFVSDEVSLDRAYVRLAAPLHAFTATIGLARAPFGGTEVLWDRDIRFSGALTGWELPSAGSLAAQRIYGGVSVGSQDREDESVTAAARWEGETAGGLSVGAAFWYFDRTTALIEAGHARTNRLAPGGEEFLSDFEIVNLSVGWERLGEHRPLRLRLDLLFNAGADDRRTGADLRADWGELQELGSWRLRLLLQRVEQDATLAAFGGDEWWFRTDQRGARLSFALSLHRRAFVEATVLRQRRDNLDDWLDRAMLDLVLLP